MRTSRFTSYTLAAGLFLPLGSCPLPGYTVVAVGSDCKLKARNMKAIYNQDAVWQIVNICGKPQTVRVYDFKPKSGGSNYNFACYSLVGNQGSPTDTVTVPDQGTGEVICLVTAPGGTTVKYSIKSDGDLLDPEMDVEPPPILDTHGSPPPAPTPHPTP